MSKSIILSTINATTINNISRFNRLKYETAESRSLFFDILAMIGEEKQEILDRRITLMKDEGKTYDEAVSMTSISFAEKCENVVTASKKKVTAEYGKIRSKILKDFGLSSKELYAAYCLGVEQNDFSATGSITLNPGKKSEKTYKVTVSFNTAVGNWLLAQGVKNAENEKCVNKYANKHINPLIGAKYIDHDNDYEAWSVKTFEDRLLGAVKRAFVNSSLIVVNNDYTVSRAREAKKS